MDKTVKQTEILLDNLDHVKDIVDTTIESWGHFRRATRSELKASRNAAKECTEIGSELSKLSKAFTAVTVAFDVGTGIVENIDKGTTFDEYLIDGLSDLAISLGEIGASAALGAGAGFVAGSVVPGAGNIVGVVVGFFGGVGSAVIIDIKEDENGQTIRDKWKDDIYEFYKSKTN